MENYGFGRYASDPANENLFLNMETNGAHVL
jgi:hypothetical protein